MQKYVSEVTKETMLSAYSDVMEKLGKRQSEVYNTLDKYSEDGMTIWELVMEMYNSEIIPRPDRNLVHPRVNELIKLEMAEVVGKKTCNITGRTVAYYTTKRA